ncbi:hypothetical protein I3F58_20750 [Streptomyces sp. MUM 203J]|uniref:hypothetical protein n=1 Tax=Streptomyces sp. MUM 203J TaxID=2791990 RepID=UPI001F037249|nr:hypothetical protein [Streptomyces sp. MUM 203J]MCH0541953.1 hypothetical protein [Streptomyces sp. MUM 203J]
METVFVILALLFLALVALGVYACVKVIGAAKRGVDRTIGQARRAVEDTTLKAKSYGQGGVVGELAQLRLSLRTSMRSTQDALEAGAKEDVSLQESLELFRRLSAHGHELDDELRRLERDPDRTRVAQQLPELRERTRRVTESADSLRWAAHDRARRFAQDDLETLSEQIGMEAGALRHWSEPAVGSDGTAGPVGADGRDRTRVSWPQAPADEASGQVWPAGPDADHAVTESGADRRDGGAARDGQASGGDRPAITGRDPRLDLGHPWEKAPRRETSD